MTNSPATTGDKFRISSVKDLQAVYGNPVPSSLAKEIDHISDHYRAFIQASPFVLLASVGEEGVDCSPRGDPAGFVRVLDSKTVLIPDRPGNNRLDTLQNIVLDPRIALLFLIPGIGETLRINGRAAITTDPDLCNSFQINAKPALSVISVRADRVYFQCPKALMRSRLWKSDAQIERSELPSAGDIISGLDTSYDGKKFDDDYPDLVKQTMY